MGKYIRHAISMLVTALVGTLLAWFGVQPDLLSPEQADALKTVTNALETVAWIFFTFVVYPIMEKWLKRFPSLDLQGFVDRLWLKREAQNSAIPPSILNR